MSNPWTPASTNKTGNYQLNQWVLEDKPRMSDFNYDNHQVDDALAQLQQQANGLSAEQAATAGGLAQLTQDFTQHNVDPNAHANLIPKGGEMTLVTATCTYATGVFTLTGLPTTLPDIFTVRFKAPADFAVGDTLSINALPYALFMPSQQPAAAGAFSANAVVSLNVDLVSGKAFLAGGGGGAGEWEEIVPTTSPAGTPIAVSFWGNKKQGLLQASINYNGSGTNVGLLRFGMSHVFTGTKTGLLTGMAWGTPPSGSNKENGIAIMRIAAGNVDVTFDGICSGANMYSQLTSPVVFVAGTCRIPPENWL